MAKLFDYVPHPHLEERKKQGPPTVAAEAAQVHGDNFFGRLNAKVGLRITVIVGTMWAAYIFAAIALISLPDNIHSTSDLILWISSSFLQLVLLPIIIVGQNIQAKASDKRAESTYEDAEAVLHEAMQIQEHLAAQDHVLSALIARLEALSGGSTPAAGAATS